MQTENKNVKIKIKSQISDLIMSDIYTTARTIDMIDDEINHTYKRGSDTAMEDYFDDAVNDKIEYSTQGTLSVNGEKIIISYEESELMGLDGCETSLYFNKISPNVVTMTRTGSVVSGLVFDPTDKRHICTYETDFMPIEFCICTRSVGNNLTYDNGGTLNLDYDIEVRGVRTERNRLTLEVINIKGGENSERC